MGIFRPARTVSTPSGQYFELYASKLILPPWREGEGGDWEPSGDARFDLLTLPLAILGVLWSILVAPLLRFLALLPFALVKRRRTHAVRIEAINDFPKREVYRWTTTDLLVDDVLDEIVAGLRSGKFVQPEGSVYDGEQSG
jgi:hypothetical protein